MADMARRGRQGGGPGPLAAKGERAGCAKLTNAQAAELRRLGREQRLSGRVLGAMFNISRQRANIIKANRAYVGN